MVLVYYFINGKKKKINAKICNPYFSLGLMFRKNSPPLLFSLKKEKKFAIASIFCKPFIAIWLDGKMRATKVLEIKNWKMSFTGYGKHLLEVPITPTK